MITGFIINAFYILFANILAFVPASSGLPSNISSSFTSVASYISSFSFLINTSVLFSVLIFTVGFEVSLLAVKGTFWLIRLIRGQ
jgi:hypothetical protein